MSALTGFLLARIAEDEAAARDTSAGIHRADCEVSAGEWTTTGVCDCGYPARVLAECEAKRQIVELHIDSATARGVGQHRNGRWTPYCQHDHEDAPCATLRFLALPHADHPDYDEEWKP